MIVLAAAVKLPCNGVFETDDTIVDLPDQHGAIEVAFICKQRAPTLFVRRAAQPIGRAHFHQA
jgi:hypothetical protein